MNCRSCDHENAASAKFCEACGARLQAACPQCGAELSNSAKFCSQCGERREPEHVASPSTLAPAAARSESTRVDTSTATLASDGEHRQLTVMFCDLVDSTALSEAIDAEDLRTVVTRFQQSCAAAIEGVGGVIAQYLGDGLLVYFGYPQAHEHDAIRGVRAALRILELMPTLNIRLEHELSTLALTQPLQIRIGLHTGPVVVGTIGGGGSRESLALGETVNVAARLQGEADPDTVLISDATRRLLGDAFVLADAGERVLKGISHPVSVFRPLRTLGDQGDFELDPKPKLSPVVGREQEIALLIDRWEKAREGRGQGLLLSSDAGMGKSRLVRALRERIGDESHGWFEFRSSAFHQNSAFHPLIDLIRREIGLNPDIEPDGQMKQLESALSEVGLATPEVIRLFSDLLSVPQSEDCEPLQLSPELQRTRTLEAMCTWVLTLAEQQPLIFIAEDLHWADASTVEFLGMLIEQVPMCPILLVLTFRPEFDCPWPKRSHFAFLTVDPLTRKQVEAMVEHLAGGKAMPMVVREHVIAKADGVPLYVEELTKSILESELLVETDRSYERTDPIPAFSIPSTLQDSLMARLDRLGPAKEVSQLAATLGREFKYPLLAAISHMDEEALTDALARLVDAELLHQRGVPPSATYVFKHALIQETAYRSLLKSTRKEYHARATRVLEAQSLERMTAEPEVLARHYREAGKTTDAIRMYELAGTQASERVANTEAIAHFENAIRLTAELTKGAERYNLEIALQVALSVPLVRSRGFGSAEAEQAYDRARVLSEQLGDTVQLADVLFGLVTSYIVQGRFDLASDLGDRQLRMAEHLGEPERILCGHYSLMMIEYFLGNSAQALQHFARLDELYDPKRHRSLLTVGGENVGVISRFWHGWALWMRGYPDRAVEACADSVSLAQEIGQPFSLALAFAWSAVLHWNLRDEKNALRLAEAAIELSELQGFPLPLGIGRLIFLRCRPEGTMDELVARAQKILGDLGATGTQAAVPQILCGFAEFGLEVGLPDVAVGYLDLAFAISASTGQPHWDAELCRAKGEILLQQQPGDDAEAESFFRRAVDTAANQGAKILELRAATCLARLLNGHGRQGEARDVLESVYGWFSEGFETHDLVQAKALLDEPAESQGEQPDVVM